MQTPFHLIGYAYGQAAADSGCIDGPDVFERSIWFKKLTELHPSILWDTTFSEASTKFHDKYLATQAICQKLAIKTRELTENKTPFVVIGGDHSSAVGTWSGVKKALPSEANLGLIWVDAHMDSHTPESSHSGNIHGMPLASLLGYGHPSLTQLIQSEPKLLPEHICVIGVRSFESEEADLLKHLGVRVFFMEEIEKRGLDVVFAEALSIVEKNTVGFGVSIDLDGIDPSEAPGVGSPEAGGLNAAALCEALMTILAKENFLGAEMYPFDIAGQPAHIT